MTIIYTHVWRHKDGHFATEGTCATSYQESVAHLANYQDSWRHYHFSYEGTYREDLTSSCVIKLDLSTELT